MTDSMCFHDFRSHAFLTVLFILLSSAQHIYGNATVTAVHNYVHGIRPEGDTVSYSSDTNIFSILEDHETKIRLFGRNLDDKTFVRFTTITRKKGDKCDNDPMTESTKVTVDSSDGSSGYLQFSFPPLHNSTSYYYLCVQEKLTGIWYHQGDTPWLKVGLYSELIPLWFQICAMIVLLLISGLFSGLNLGLMALDRTELSIILNTGTENERKYASIILPVRQKGNYLLCSLLLSNTLVNSSLTIFMDNISTGLIAVLVSTISIVVFGEIIPQAICARHGLMIGANTVYLTKLFMLLTFPVSYPISKLLDVCLGEELGNVYNRERLKELIKVTHGLHDLAKDEVNIISGALDLRRKTVEEVMTNLDDVFMLHIETILDFETITQIMKNGYTRIPVYGVERNKIVSLLNIKDLAFIDSASMTPLRTVCEFYKHRVNFVFVDTTLSVMLDEFKIGRSHMAFVQRVVDDGVGDPYYEVIGVVTLEDVIEEIIQAEIVDETDIFLDNRKKQRRKGLLNQDFTVFAQQSDRRKVQIPAPLTLATFQYLHTAVDPFKAIFLSENVLRLLMKQDIFFQFKLNRRGTKDSSKTYLYQRGKGVDYFIMILEGRVEVCIGKEDMKFEAGPFTYFGKQALIPFNAIGDVQPVTSRAGCDSSFGIGQSLPPLIEGAQISPDQPTSQGSTEALVTSHDKSQTSPSSQW